MAVWVVYLEDRNGCVIGSHQYRFDQEPIVGQTLELGPEALTGVPGGRYRITSANVHSHLVTIRSVHQADASPAPASP